MTDPRIAALAEALRKHARQFSDGSWLLLFDEGRPAPTIEDFAAAILDALPPDWCEHDLITSHRECVESIAALRRKYEAIEEAARALVLVEPDERPVAGWHVRFHALRAALEADR